MKRNNQTNTGMFSRSNKSTSKNDGLPFVSGKKVTVNRGRNKSNSRRGSLSKGEEKNETMKRYLLVGVAMAIFEICLYLYQTNSVGYSVVVPEISDSNVVTIPSPAKPKAASVPADITVPVPVVPLAPPPPALQVTTCTAEQRELVLKQLPNNAACTSNHDSGCSFRVATSGCQNPILARTFFANTNDFRPVASASSSVPIPFTAVIAGWGNNYIPLDLLQIGSGLDPKYGKDWSALRLNNEYTCRAPITSTTAATKEGDQPTRLPPQVVVLDWGSLTSSVLNELNEKYHDKELVIEDTINMNGNKDSLTTLIQSKLPATNVLHYLDLVGRSNGYDYIILMKLLPELLQNVRFLHFEYNKIRKWSSPSYTLKELIAHLKTNGLICYWSGDEQTQYGLWRITDCFLDHYNYKHWSRIQCVSGTHSDVKELATRMETQFITTIQRKDSSFGG